jgi:hypothetical protein
MCRATAIADKAGQAAEDRPPRHPRGPAPRPPLATKLLWNLARELGKRAEEAQIQLSKPATAAATRP